MKMEQKKNITLKATHSKRTFEYKNPGKINELKNGMNKKKKSLNQNTNITGTMLKTLRFFLFHFRNFMHKSINV